MKTTIIAIPAHGYPKPRLDDGHHIETREGPVSESEAIAAVRAAGFTPILPGEGGDIFTYKAEDEDHKDDEVTFVTVVPNATATTS